MKPIVFLLCLMMLSSFGLAQNYIPYYRLINRAEELFVENKDSSCFAYYDAAFDTCEPFLKDPYIAAQIALFLGDTIRFDKYISLGFKQGMPLSSINSSPLIQSANKGDFKEHITSLYEQNFKEKLVDKAILDEICLRCYRSDSLKAYMENDPILVDEFNAFEHETRNYLLEQFLQFGKFPNQRLIGITKDETLERFHQEYNRPDLYMLLYGVPGFHGEEQSLRTKCPYNIILHSRCFFREHKELFIQAMKNGYLHPMDIAILEEHAIVWNESGEDKREICPEAAVRLCYNVYTPNPIAPHKTTYSEKEEDLKQVEENRASIYMQKFSVDLQKKRLEEAYGFKFFFDFKNR